MLGLPAALVPEFSKQMCGRLPSCNIAWAHHMDLCCQALPLGISVAGHAILALLLHIDFQHVFAF